MLAWGGTHTIHSSPSVMKWALDGCHGTNQIGISRHASCGQERLWGLFLQCNPCFLQHAHDERVIVGVVFDEFHKAFVTCGPFIVREQLVVFLAQVNDFQDNGRPRRAKRRA